MDEDLDKKTIIFDDPISSFDRERKRKTSHLLLDIECNGKKPEQVFILTHQEDFLKDLARDLDSFGERYTTLRVEPGSLELVADVKKEFPDDEILSRLDKLKKLIGQESINNDFSKDCRIVLENIMKRKYYSKLSEIIKSNPRASIRRFVDEIYPNDEQTYKDFVRLCNDLQVPLHDNSIPAPSAGDKKSILQDFFKILEKI